ncbi:MULTISPECIES: alginate export family protein [Sphingomonas]|uniref:Alginate export family protein n=1 Tax=Sphingomonas molluscorum TaxID=418184 RepID=A0ABU8Q130_9SPHN|nr:hypothetical protein [Sphingomonas sp. JUb134]
MSLDRVGGGQRVRSGPGATFRPSSRSGRAVRLGLLLSCLPLAWTGAPAAHAQEAETSAPEPAPHHPLSLTGSMRVRYEALRGQAHAGFPDTDSLLSIRTTVLLAYAQDRLRAGVELQDSRGYFGKRGGEVSANDVNAFEWIQAYAGLTVGSEGLVRIGRVKFDVGSRRLVAAHDYRNTASAFTGLVATLPASGGTATLFYTLPQQHRPDDQDAVLANRVQWDHEGFDLQFWGTHLAGVPIGSGTLDIGYFGLNERDTPDRPTRNRKLHSLDLRLADAPGRDGADFELEAVYQFGSIRADTTADAAELPVSAWFVHAAAGYRFPGAPHARVSLTYDQASGDGSGGRYGRFDTLFGARRSDLGPGAIYGAVGRANILTPSVRLEVTPNQRLDGFLAYRAMWLDSRTDSFSTTAVRDASGGSGRFAGHQVEGRVRWWLLPHRAQLELNAAWLKKGRFLKEAPNAPSTGDTLYGAVSLSIPFGSVVQKR